MLKTVLIVDDEIDIQSSLSFALKDEGYEVFTATLPAQAEEILSREKIDIGLFDVWFPEGDGMDLLKKTRQKNPDTSVVMMSGHGNIELALSAIRTGAYDFLEKPLELEKVLVVLRNASETQKLKEENKRLNLETVGSADILGNSPSIQNLRNSLDKAAKAQSHVLIQGENGTGKELVARLLHFKGVQQEGPFVALNCAAIPETLFESTLFGHEKGAFTGATQRSYGRFEQAAGGTLFLDEISELSLATQGKLLRVLEDKKFERVGGQKSIRAQCRIIAATNRDLSQRVRDGQFREDLFFRLKVLLLTVPPLRERREDIAELTQYFVKKMAIENRRAEPQLTNELLTWFRNYEWPGNVRELRNLIERMLIMSDQESLALGISDLPEELQVGFSRDAQGAIFREELSGSLRNLRAQFEKQLIEKRLKEFDQNVTRTSESLGLERAHLYRKLKLYGIQSSNA
jgi:two-component system nitrogen regulation response regulator NtrX